VLDAYASMRGYDHLVRHPEERVLKDEAPKTDPAPYLDRALKASYEPAAVQPGFCCFHCFEPLKPCGKTFCGWSGL
jgi:hypothetical protein